MTSAEPDGAKVASVHRMLGLTDQEYDEVTGKLGREPNPTELAMFAAMWSEHCSYKSSRIHLRTLPTEGPQVLVGPGQDAGAVDLGDGMACVFKIESHSHPSAIEPFQGAATGVGGIVRDVLSMGARPVALLDPLRFGPLDGPTNRYLFGGVVAGIGGYGNSIGVPTVGGEVKFAPCHGPNPTVNVMCVGFARADRLLFSPGGRAGSVMVLIGASTGRDGIGGVSVLASRTLEEDAHRSRPSVQIGDPFAENVLIELCLELGDRRLLRGLQDLGGAGLTCAVSESTARAGLGADIDLDEVPLREPGMEPFEILTSESQERMLAIVDPEDVVEVERICRKWGLSVRLVAKLRGGGQLFVRHEGRLVARVPARALAEEAPVYERPMRRPAWLDRLREDDLVRAPLAIPVEDAFLAVLGSPGVASMRWVYEQYDSMVQGQTVLGPASGLSDAAVIRVDGTTKAVAISTDGNGRFGFLDPYLAGAHAVAESARNVAVVGARPLAVTNCLNFGNPERPEVMWAFSEAVRGMGDACRALGTPVTGGNVSIGCSREMGSPPAGWRCISWAGRSRSWEPASSPRSSWGRCPVALPCWTWRPSIASTSFFTSAPGRISWPPPTTARTAAWRLRWPSRPWRGAWGSPCRCPTKGTPPTSRCSRNRLPGLWSPRDPVARTCWNSWPPWAGCRWHGWE